jgi:uncharacterized protein YlxP (DUF503 family)
MKTVLDILIEKFNVPISEYWTLTEEQKREITDILDERYQETLKDHPELFFMYVTVLNQFLRIAEQNEEFVKCDMLKRIIYRMRNRFNFDEFNLEESD